MTEQTGDPRSPWPIPISSRVVVPNGAAFDAVRRALAAIDAVHGDGDLPTIPVVRTRATTEAGAYEWDGRSGNALRLRPSGLGNHPELTVVHEIGHFLDHQALGRPGVFASESGAMHRLMAAMERSATIARIRVLRGQHRVMVDERGRRESEVIRQHRVAYLLRPTEMFARAYAQFISRESQDPWLLQQLEAERASRRGRVYHDFWADSDFELLAHELRRMLGRRRWMRSR